VTGQPGSALVVDGATVAMSGSWLEIALRAVLVAERHRRGNGLGPSPEYDALAHAIHEAMTARGHSDITEPRPVQDCVQMLTTEELAPMLNVCERQCRRLARRLDGRKVKGRWLIPEPAAIEHLDGR
jgi:hypothetical protein